MEFLKRLFKLEKSSSEIAKERLKLVLIHDRANCNSDFLEEMKEDLIKVIRKYMEIDEEALRVEMTETEKEDGSKILVPMLYANIPIKSVKRVSEEEN